MNATKQATPMSPRARRERLADAYESLREGTRFTQAAADYLYRVDGREGERDELERLTARLREVMDAFRTEAEAISPPPTEVRPARRGPATPAGSPPGGRGPHVTTKERRHARHLHPLPKTRRQALRKRPGVDQRGATSPCLSNASLVDGREGDP